METKLLTKEEIAAQQILSESNPTGLRNLLIIGLIIALFWVGFAFAYIGSKMEEKRYNDEINHIEAVNTWNTQIAELANECYPGLNIENCKLEY